MFTSFSPKPATTKIKHDSAYFTGACPHLNLHSDQASISPTIQRKLAFNRSIVYRTHPWTTTHFGRISRVEVYPVTNKPASFKQNFNTQTSKQFNQSSKLISIKYGHKAHKKDLGWEGDEMRWVIECLVVTSQCDQRVAQGFMRLVTKEKRRTGFDRERRVDLFLSEREDRVES
jgi:hypothetical protein